MITCKIIIEEVPGKGYYIDMTPDQSKATLKEKHAASLFDIAFGVVGQYILQKAERGQVLERKDLDAIRGLANEMIAKFKSSN